MELAPNFRVSSGAQFEQKNEEFKVEKPNNYKELKISSQSNK